MVSRAEAKRQAEFLGTDVPDEASPPSPPAPSDPAATPQKRKRGRPPKNPMAGLNATPATSSQPSSAAPTPAKAKAASPTTTLPRHDGPTSTLATGPVGKDRPTGLVEVDGEQTLINGGTVVDTPDVPPPLPPTPVLSHPLPPSTATPTLAAATSTAGSGNGAPLTTGTTVMRLNGDVGGPGEEESSSDEELVGEDRSRKLGKKRERSHDEVNGVKEEEEVDPVKREDISAEEARKLLKVLETFGAGDFIDQAVDDAGGDTLRSLLSSGETVSISDLAVHIAALPPSPASEKLRTLAFSLLRSLQSQTLPPTASPSTYAKPTSKRRKTHHPHPSVPSVLVSTEGKPRLLHVNDQAGRQKFVLHRYLDPPDGAPLGYAGLLGTGMDVFTGPGVELDDDEVELLSSRAPSPFPDRGQTFTKQATVKDTDLVALPPPHDDASAFSASLIDPGLLKDLVPAPVLTKKEEKAAKKRVGKVEPRAGTDVSPLYYSPYSSFAPAYDSSSATKTAAASTTSFLSQQKVRRWAARPERLAPSAPPASSTSQLNISVPEKYGDSLKSALGEVPADEARSLVNAQLARNADLLQRLHQRHFDRLRSAVSVATPTVGGGRLAPLEAGLEVGRDERADADALLTSLARLVKLSSPSAGIVPRPEELRTAQKTLVQERGANVAGTLQLVNSRAVREGVLTTKWEP